MALLRTLDRISKALLIACTMALCGVGHAQNQTRAESTQVKPQSGILVELFTSEGCSSCPPADELLRKIDSHVTDNGTPIVVLGEHVDYWDATGWHDRFSSHDFTERQQEYARRFNTSGPYTPQMVVDGRREFVGNDGRLLEAALSESATKPRATLKILIGELSGSEVTLHVKVGELPAATKHCDLYVALADNSDETRVGGGENSGRSLHHAAAVRSLQKVAKVGPEGLEKEIRLRIPKAGNLSNLRAVAYVQELDFGPVIGAATVQLSSGSNATQ